MNQATSLAFDIKSYKERIMGKLISQLLVRLEPQVAEKLGEFCDRTDTSAQDITRHLIRAFTDHVERFGEVTLPLAITTKSEIDALRASRFNPLAAEADQSATDAVALQNKIIADAKANAGAKTAGAKPKPRK